MIRLKTILLAFLVLGVLPVPTFAGGPAGKLTNPVDTSSVNLRKQGAVGDSNTYVIEPNCPLDVRVNGSITTTSGQDANTFSMLANLTRLCGDANIVARIAALEAELKVLADANIAKSVSGTLTVKDGNIALMVKDGNSFGVNLNDSNIVNRLIAIETRLAQVSYDANQTATSVRGVQASTVDPNAAYFDGALTFTNVQITRGTTGYKLLSAAPGSGKVVYILGAALMADADDANAAILTANPDPNLLTTDPNVTFTTANVLPFYWANAGGIVMTPQSHARLAWYSSEANVPVFFRCTKNFCGVIKIGVK